MGRSYAPPIYSFVILCYDELVGSTPHIQRSHSNKDSVSQSLSPEESLKRSRQSGEKRTHEVILVNLL